MFVLPVSAATVVFRPPSGYDDLLLAEHVGDVRLRVEMVRRLAPPARADEDWTTLPFVDVDAALLGLRRFLEGDRLIAEIQCGACSAWGDVAFSIAEYLDAHRPRRAARARVASIPTVGHVLAAIEAHGPGPAAIAALEASYGAEHGGGADARKALARLEKAAPALSGPIEGVCPQCAAPVSAWFDPGAFVLAEMRPRAQMIYDEVHLLASAYGWTEDGILSLPGPRRAAYAARIAHGSGAS